MTLRDTRLLLKFREASKKICLIINFTNTSPINNAINYSIFLSFIFILSKQFLQNLLCFPNYEYDNQAHFLTKDTFCFRSYLNYIKQIQH